MLSESTIASAISALKIVHGSLGEPSQHFSSEIQREARDEIVHAIADLLRERDELAELQADAGGVAGGLPMPDDVAWIIRGVLKATIARIEREAKAEKRAIWKGDEGTIDLCRAALAWLDKQTQPAPVVAVPVPDWSTAPTWAMWWAVDADGDVCYHETEPQANKWRNMWDQDGNGVVEYTHNIDVPLGTDWRVLKQARPQPPQEPQP